jgi:hypothetical protein
MPPRPSFSTDVEEVVPKREIATSMQDIKKHTKKDKKGKKDKKKKFDIR